MTRTWKAELATLSPSERLAFDAVSAAARAGLRCPTRDSHGALATVFPKLALRGFLRIEISGRNWRRVVIERGPDTGKATLADPAGYKPKWVIDKAGSRRDVSVARLRDAGVPAVTRPAATPSLPSDFKTAAP